MAEAVVHHLEPIETEVEHGEALASLALEFVEPTAEPFDEDAAVAQSGERVAEAGAAKLLLLLRAFGRIGQRAGDARPIAAAHGERAAQVPAIGAVLVA